MLKNIKLIRSSKVKKKTICETHCFEAIKLGSEIRSENIKQVYDLTFNTTAPVIIEPKQYSTNK
jgi:hypothetical protein